MAGAEKATTIVDEIIPIKEKSISLYWDNMKGALKIRIWVSEALSSSENPNYFLRREAKLRMPLEGVMEACAKVPDGC